MERMYNGEALDSKYVQHILILGKKALSGLETIYDVPLPSTQDDEVQASRPERKGFVTVSTEG